MDNKLNIAILLLKALCESPNEENVIPWGGGPYSDWAVLKSMTGESKDGYVIGDDGWGRPATSVQSESSKSDVSAEPTDLKDDETDNLNEE